MPDGLPKMSESSQPPRSSPSSGSAMLRWAERIYSETDVARSIATSAAGVVGLGVYIWTADWVLGAFSLIITFPLARLISSRVFARLALHAGQLEEREKARLIYRRLGPSEERVVQAFVDEGCTVLSWTQVNQMSLPAPAIESLIEREVIRCSATADSMRETFVLSADVFDAAREGK